MYEPTIIEYKNMRVLTTQQIAEAYETEQQIITNNFNRNKERYIEGKHYICLTGQEKADFIKKNRSVVCLLKQPCLSLRNGAGECARFISEQFTL